jgi:hypothetical protein
MSDYETIRARAIDAGETGDCIANIVVATWRMINRIPAATRRAPLEAAKLVEQARIVD